MADRRPVHAKLFRAVVVMGAALTSGCGDNKPPVDARLADASTADGHALADAGADGQVGDAPVDVVLIL